jgi:hypothetical protein
LLAEVRAGQSQVLVLRGGRARLITGAGWLLSTAPGFLLSATTRSQAWASGADGRSGTVLDREGV